MFRRLAQIFLLLAVTVAAVDLATGFPDRAGSLADLGTWWAAIDIDSLQLLQPAIQRHVAPWLWDFGVQPLLLWPLAVEIAVLAALFWLLGGRRETDGRPTRTGSAEIRQSEDGPD